MGSGACGDGKDSVIKGTGLGRIIFFGNIPRST